VKFFLVLLFWLAVALLLLQQYNLITVDWAALSILKDTLQDRAAQALIDFMRSHGPTQNPLP
jgi:uncharacterized membrane protein (Fun14 family)